MTQREPEGSLAERLSLPGRLSAGNIDAIQKLFVFFGYHMVIIEVGRKTISRRVYVPVFAFIFQVKGHMCHICLSLKKQTLRRFNEHSDV